MEYQKTTPEDDLENDCYFCGTPCENTYCSTYCKKADYDD